MIIPTETALYAQKDIINSIAVTGIYEQWDVEI